MNKPSVHLGLVLAIAVGCLLFHGGCATKGTIEIGCISPFTGDGAVYGEALKRGFEVYLDELKANDPSTFEKIRIIYEDDKLEAREGINAIRKLIDIDKVQVIIGAFTSNVTLAIAPIAEQEKIVLVTPTATNYKIKDAGDYIFRVTPSDAFQGKVMADFVSATLGMHSASILYMNTDYGFGLKSVFEEQFLKNGGKILNVESFDMGATDMRTQLQKIKARDPEAIFVPSNYVEAVNVMRQAKELGVSSQFVCTDGVFEQDFLKLTEGVSDGMYLSTMAWGTAEYRQQAEHFRSKFRTKFGEDPGVYSALCYDALAIVVEALKTSEYSGPSIKKQLYTIEFIGATGLNKFDKYGEVEKGFDIYEVRNNQFVRIDRK